MMRLIACPRWVLIGVLLWLPLATGTAQESLLPTGDEGSEPVVEQVPIGLQSPRATMESFLHGMNDIKRGKPERLGDALATLDLSEVSPLIRRERGKDLAWMLLEVLDRTRYIRPEAVPDHRDGAPYLFERYASGTVQIVRQEDGRWLFDRATIAVLPDILDEISNRRRVVPRTGDQAYVPWHIEFRQGLPEGMRERSFLLENWQWLGIFFAVLLGVVVDRLVARLLALMVRGWRRRGRGEGCRDVSEQILRPFGLMGMAVVWWLGINLLTLPEGAMLVLLVAVKFLASASGVWAAYRLVDLASAYLQERAGATENKFDDVLVPLVRRTLKIFVTVVGFVFVADNLNIDISSLLAGLGLGGLAFALAAKDMVQNLFGSITVLLDRTFAVGDWIIVDGIEGTVERLGFRSTRIRTFYNSVVTVPNSKFITAEVDNMGERRYRRLRCKLSLTYATPPEKIEAFCEGLRELVRCHPYMRKDYYHIYLNEFAASSLEVLVYVFWETPDWSTELRERHRFLLDAVRLAKKLGVEFAFPTQTLFLHREEEGETSGGRGLEGDAQELGRIQAREIVATTTGMGVKPPPVEFPKVSN